MSALAVALAVALALALALLQPAADARCASAAALRRSARAHTAPARRERCDGATTLHMSRAQAADSVHYTAQSKQAWLLFAAVGENSAGCWSVPAFGHRMIHRARGPCALRSGWTAGVDIDPRPQPAPSSLAATFKMVPSIPPQEPHGLI